MCIDDELLLSARKFLKISFWWYNGPLKNTCRLLRSCFVICNQAGWWIIHQKHPPQFSVIVRQTYLSSWVSLCSLIWSCPHVVDCLMDCSATWQTWGKFQKQTWFLKEMRGFKGWAEEERERRGSDASRASHTPGLLCVTDVLDSSSCNLTSSMDI